MAGQDVQNIAVYAHLDKAEILNVQPPNDMQCGMGKNNI